MIFHEAERREARPIPLQPLRGERGQLARAFWRRELAAAGPHVRRQPHAEARLVRCLRGGVPCAIAHLRPGSRSGLRHDDPGIGIGRPRPARPPSARGAAWPPLALALPPSLQEVPA